MPEALLIGGRSGSGKSTVGWEVSALLGAAGIVHAYVEGDTVGNIVPPPADDPNRSRITETNLTAMWANFARTGCARLVYTNTASVLEPDMFERALGGSARLTPVMLTAGDATVAARLGGREIGSELESHIKRSSFMARYLDENVPQGTIRVATDGRTVTEIAREIVAATGWS
ncbi:hypothetical protein [Phytomonospora endophytica]|uniref:Uncharacterized protein n=1 Tax=Phytomonospora endophytica TaxID=714109 RepID=A0A841FZ05_9ACTN|nr:hypothetical protein [Phytomonospora endophytica]MBB6038948.1 hypothetical protein [Phytomonospora endophytica]GIG67950.1 hypothetical protein Pen01_42450 [Phytomonospora endophytica]